MSDEERPSKLPSLSEVFGITNQDSLGSLHSSLSRMQPLSSSSNLSLPGSVHSNDLTAFALQGQQPFSAVPSIRSTGSLERRGYQYAASETSSSSGASSSASRITGPPSAPPRSSSLRTKASRASRKLPSIQTGMHDIPEGPSLMSIANQLPRAGVPPQTAADPLQRSAYYSGQIPYSPLPSAQSLQQTSNTRHSLDSPRYGHSEHEEQMRRPPSPRSTSFDTFNRSPPPRLPPPSDQYAYRERIPSIQASLYPASTRSSDASSARTSFSFEYGRSSISSNPSSLYDYGQAGPSYRRPVTASDRTTSRSGYPESDMSSMRSASPPKSPFQSPSLSSASQFDSGATNMSPFGPRPSTSSSSYSASGPRLTPKEEAPSDYGYPSTSYYSSMVEHRAPITSASSPNPIMARDNPMPQMPQIPDNQTLPPAAQPPPGFRPAPINPFQRQSQSSMSGKYFCEFCNKRFNRPSSLRIHMHSHSGEKPFPCELCGRAFSVNSNLRRHLRVHEKYAAMEQQPPGLEDTEMGNGSESEEE